MPRNSLFALIGGSGFSAIEGFRQRERRRVDSRWGSASAELRLGDLEGVELVFLARHGEPHAIAPHLVNYRANIWALRECGVTDVVAINAVGGIAREALAGTLWTPHQIVDYTWGRENSFHDGTDLPLRHQEFAQPFDPELRERLLRAAAEEGIALGASAVYGCTQGPRLETAAEIERMRRDGCDLVGMTAMPEAVLAAELGMRYASLAMVVNLAAGCSEEPISMEAIERVAAECAGRVARLLRRLVKTGIDGGR